ncbi:MAG: VanZ family protein [Gemmatimonadota bacterium]
MQTGARFGSVLLAYLVAVALVITLVPFEFIRPATLRFDLTVAPSDVIANVLLFFPLGFLARLSFGARGGRLAWRILLAGLLLSGAIECLQEFERARFPSPIDVATNGVGVWFGAMVHDRVVRRLAVDAGLLGRLSLELPLMGIVYLLIPLLWLDSLAIGGTAERVLLTVPLGLFGVVVLTSIHRHQWHLSGTLSHAELALLAGGWFLVGAFPALPERPVLMAVVALIITGTAFLLALSPRWLAEDRRYEVWAIRRGLPFLAAYLLVLATPLGPFGPSSQLNWTLGIGEEAGTVTILRYLELLGGLTLLGYIIAELRGRREERFRKSVAIVCLWVVPPVTFCEVLRGFEPGGAGAGRWLSLIAGALFGALVYHLQRDHVRALVELRIRAISFPAIERGSGHSAGLSSAARTD